MSITAVFLALAIGVVMGTSFLGKATVDQLKTQIKRAERRIDATEKTNSRLTGEVKRLNQRDDAMRLQGPQLLAEHLTDEPVLIIASANIDRTSLASLQASLEATAADFRGTLVVNPKLRLAGDDVAKMSDLLGLTTTELPRVRRILAARVATMLATAGRSVGSGGSSAGPSSTTTTIKRSPVPPTTAPNPFATTRPPQPRVSTTTTTTTSPAPAETDQPELLTELRKGGWLSYRPPEDGSADDLLLTTGGYRFVFVSGAGAAVPDQDFLRPVAVDLGGTEPAPVVFASAAVGDDPEATRLVSVRAIRELDPVNKNVSTVDDLESFDGDAAVVLALDDLIEVHGHYGVGDGATSLLPPTS
ncbi:MAG: copper transporter [Actinomycetota bacterium]|nr:copper transporter [Actinomycetota bacterium]